MAAQRRQTAIGGWRCGRGSGSAARRPTANRGQASARTVTMRSSSDGEAEVSGGGRSRTAGATASSSARKMSGIGAGAEAARCSTVRVSESSRAQIPVAVAPGVNVRGAVSRAALNDVQVFGSPAEDADCLLGPPIGDQRALLRGAGGQAVGRRDGQQGHDHRPRAAGAGAEKVSRNSFSSRRSSSWCAATASNSPAMFISVR